MQAGEGHKTNFTTKETKTEVYVCQWENLIEIRVLICSNFNEDYCITLARLTSVMINTIGSHVFCNQNALCRKIILEI